MTNQYEDLDADDVAQEERNMEIYGSKRRKISGPSVNCPESREELNMQPSPNGSRSTSLACLDEAHATVCSADISNMEVVARHDASLKDGKENVLEGSQIECTGLGQESPDSKNKTDIEKSELTTDEDSPGKLFVSDRAGENYEQVGQSKSSANGIAVHGVYGADEKLEPKNIFEDEKPSVETSTLSNPIDKLGMNVESKMDASHSVSELVAPKENVSQTVNEEDLPPSSCIGSGHTHSRKKLLVLDVNGLIVDIVANPQEGFKPDAIIGLKAVFKRPYCDEFLRFCFEKFNVGVWTSRTRRNIERVLDFLIKDTQHQLLFCWDQSHCTETGYNTIENKDKPLVFKELKKLWEKQEPNLPWDRGTYDESNTLLLDDSPYKALRNPPYTAIFPHTYCYHNGEDNSLGPGGDLRNYLERLSVADNVQKFIAENPFGQHPITENNQSWRFYLEVMGATSSELEAEATGSTTVISSLEINTKNGHSRPRKKLIVLDLQGLLVDVVSDTHESHRADPRERYRDPRERYRADPRGRFRADPRDRYRSDSVIRSKTVYKRPYCDEFLQFCFKKFNVGVWTSSPRRHTEWVLDFLLGDAQQQLLFCWDRYHCTNTGFTTVENWDKPLVLKELKLLWEKQDPNLPWDRGEYDESNTLLLENHPYSALRNPPHTAIFPYAYRYSSSEDNSLGPQGDLRTYLERLAVSDNVQKFVKENPFGQRPITENNLSWKFYLKVLRATSSEPEPDPTCSFADAQHANSSEPEAQWANSSEPEAQLPNSYEPEAEWANSSEPEAQQANSYEPEAQRANSSEPEACRANSSEPEARGANSSQPEAGRANSSEPEAHRANSSEPEAHRANSSEPEARRANSSEPETVAINS